MTTRPVEILLAVGSMLPILVSIGCGEGNPSAAPPDVAETQQDVDTAPRTFAFSIGRWSETASPFRPLSQESEVRVREPETDRELEPPVPPYVPFTLVTDREVPGRFFATAHFVFDGARRYHARRARIEFEPDASGRRVCRQLQIPLVLSPSFLARPHDVRVGIELRADGWRARAQTRFRLLPSES